MTKKRTNGHRLFSVNGALNQGSPTSSAIEELSCDLIERVAILAPDTHSPPLNLPIEGHRYE